MASLISKIAYGYNNFIFCGAPSEPAVTPPTPPTGDSNSVKETCRHLAFDVIHTKCSTVSSLQSITRRSGSGLNSRLSKTMRRVVSEMTQRHEILFRSMVKQLTSPSSPFGLDIEDMRGLFFEVFSDGQYNWGRVAAVYAFAGWLAEYCTLHDLRDKIGVITEATASFVEDNLSMWIIQQGGWEVFERHFREEESMESVLWKGMLCTFVGLGTLATITALN